MRWLILLLIVPFASALIDDNLHLYYDFEELDVSDLNDLKGTNDADIYGASASHSAIVGDAYNFDGVNDYMKTESQVNWTDDMSFMLWMNGSDKGYADTALLGRYTYKQFVIWNEYTAGSYHLHIRTGTGSGWDTACDSNTEVNDKTWHHVVVTFDNSANEIEIYIDGDSVQNCSNTISTPSSDDALYIGVRSPSSNYYNGSIDELGVWNRIITASEVQYLYNDGAGVDYPFSGDQPPIISNIVCISPTPDDSTSPYETDDVTPTFTFNTDENAWCYISDKDIDYQNMTVECQGSDSQNQTAH